MPFLLGRAFIIPALYIYIYSVYTSVTLETEIGRKNVYTSQNRHRNRPDQEPVTENISVS